MTIQLLSYLWVQFALVHFSVALHAIYSYNAKLSGKRAMFVFVDKKKQAFHLYIHSPIRLHGVVFN
jgi:hypothetical protein